MLTMSTANLRVGWFSGSGGGSRQYIGPGGYFSTEGFPPEAYTVAPDWEKSPEVSVAEQVLAEDVVGGLPGAGTIPALAPPVSKMLGSMAVAQLPQENFYIPMLFTGPGRSSQDFYGQMAPPVAAIGLIVPGAIWIARMLGISGIIGVSGWILDVFKFGRVFMYWKGEAIGSLPPDHAFLWYFNLNGNQQRLARLRMEAADKGGKFQRFPIPGVTETQTFRSKSFLERLNPFHGGDSFIDRINPFT